MSSNDAVSIISLSDLFNRNQPLTGASSLSSTSKLKHIQISQTAPPLHSLNSPNPNPKTLTPLKIPSVLVGTLTLPHEFRKCSSKKSCFQFTDDSGSVCCDVVDFRVSVIGKRIRVIAWNFVPLKHSGFLEIIKWSFLDLNYSGGNVNVLSRCGNLDSVALVSDVSEVKLKGCCCVFGPIESVSPVSCVPCSFSDGKSQNLRGFVALILVCECNLCNSIKSGSITNIVIQENDNHRFKKSLFLYFYGSASCWHPVITKLVGSVVALSKLKKKMVFIGKEESQLMYVTTESSVLYVHFPAKKWVASERKSIKGRGECGDYTGIVKGVYMQRMVVELDKEVWLLLTDKLLVVPHSLRLGAIISVRNVHFVNPKFPWTKMLILGACCKTSITVESFSPFETKSHNLSQTENQLGKFIESLTFSAQFWALLLISCFLEKFAGVLSKKEILGSKDKEGAAQKFATSHLSPLMFRARHGVLAESCKHDSLSCGSVPCCSDLKLVLPITTFLHYCETIWIRALPQFKRKDQKYGALSCEKIYGAVPLRRIFLSKDINVLLLGSLKISPSSGRLQLGDSTGSIDVTFADSPSNWMAYNIYELVNYCIVMEGVPDLSVDLLQYLDYGTLSCRHIFHGNAQERELKLGIYACIQSRNAACKNCLIYRHPSQDLDFEQSLSGRFHLILIIHKYPMLQKQFQVGQMTVDGSTIFVEAVLLPWDVSLAGKDGFLDPFEDSGLLLNYSLDDDTGKNDEIFLPRKRHKPDQTSSGAFALCSTDDQLDGGRELGIFFSSLEARMKCGNVCFHRTSCTAKVYNVSGSHLLVAGQLCCTNCAQKNGADCKRSMVKVLLEFNFESFFKYQLLQIGKCYMIKHHGDAYFCGTSESDDFSVDKILVTSKTHIWSLSFSSDNVTGSNVSSDDVSCYSSIFGNEDVLMKDGSELTLKWPTVSSPVSFSDVCLHLCTDVKVLIEEKLKEIKDGLIKITIVQEYTFDDPLHTLNAISVSESSNSSCLFPEGNLATVLGNVVAIHDFDFNSADLHLRCESEGDCFHRKFFEGLKGSFCFHVLVENQMVNICSTLSNYAYPIGFGPGVTATFHRLLKLRGPCKWMLTPVSFIVINSISEVNEPCRQRFSISSDFPSSMHMPQISTLENVSSGIIYDLIRSERNKQMLLYCRVVAVHFLVLEKNRKYNYTSKANPTSPNVNIPVAGFLLDDGSSACCCWASSLQAAMLLRLHEEIPMTALRSSSFEVKRTEVGNRTTVYHLERILRKHERITVRSFGSMFYSSLQELTISVSPEDTLCCSDETLLKFIIFNACLGTSWTVLASAMDPDAIKQLEKDYLAEMDLPLHITDHVWAVEICHTDALAASKNLIQGLLSR